MFTGHTSPWVAPLVMSQCLSHGHPILDSHLLRYWHPPSWQHISIACMVTSNETHASRTALAGSGPGYAKDLTD